MLSVYSTIIKNKWVLEVLYALIVSSICMVIVLKADKFYKLSLHQGIRYFRNAFFFYGIAFAVRYIFGLFCDLYGIFSNFSVIYFDIMKISFEYFLVMAGFFLFYSLVWKRFESQREEYTSSLFNAKIAIFHAMAFVIATLDFLWHTYYFMFFSQIVIFSCASIIAYTNYKNKGRKHKFLKFYFIAMLLSFAAWILNFLTASYFKWNHGVLINIGIINTIFFLLFLYGVIRFTKK